MPTFTAIALDRLLEPDAPKSMIATKTVSDPELEKQNSVSSRVGRGVHSTSTRLDRGVSVPPKLENGTSLPSSKTDSKNGTSAATVERHSHWTRISPALYATPKSTPIPDSPSSFPPSPYVINHKRRGPRLLKSYSEDDVGTNQRGLESHNVDRHENNSEHLRSASDDSSILKRVVGSASDEFSTSAVPTPGQEKEENDSFESVPEVHVEGSLTPDNQVDGTFNLANQENVNGHCDTDSQAREIIPNLADQINAENTESFISQGEDDEFLYPRDSVSSKRSTEIDAVSGIEQSTNSAIALAEFYDAWEGIFLFS
ncbi:hypothetical protein LIER_34814 [Lithospermum erythrorhizon]|uniref:Uncharacterized protein n=1 Tax=Lithospermum erythrorhizon TaxID=34254 RepID=A0AAV3S4J9_LITER